jgi:hypothetical protein
MADLIPTVIEATDYSKLSLYEQYAAAAYCPDNYNPGTIGRPVACRTANCPNVTAAGATIALTYT